MLKSATPVGASSNNGLLLVGESSMNACCEDLIKEYFHVPVVPCMMILSEGFGEGFLK